MIKADKYYIQNLKEILENGSWDENPRPSYKDGEKANSKFITGVFETYDISKGEFPITTLRNTATLTGIKEVLWIYQKQNSSLESARDMGIMWWDEWNIGDGTIGERYGKTIQNYDLMNKLLKSLKEDPFSRRHIMNMYQEADLKSKGLHPCAYETIWSVRKQGNDYYVDMTLIQRSNDYIMAGYINKIQYTALLMMVCSHLGYKPGKFSHLVQNLHIYDRHIEASKELLKNEPLDQQPTLVMNEKDNFYDYTIKDFKVENKDGIPKLKSDLEIAI
jgi:thymidylate synthase